MHNLFIYLIIISLGIVSFISCLVAEFKRTKEKDVQWDTDRNCSIPGSHAFGLGSAAILCLCLAQIFGNILVFQNHRKRPKTADGSHKTNDLILSTVFLLLSWSNFVVVVLILSTAISMSRKQGYGKGWLEEDCYLVKDGVFAASGCLALFGLGALTISATKMSQKKQQVVQVENVKDEMIISKDQDQEQRQNQDHDQTKSETIIYLVEEVSSTRDTRRI